MLPAAALGCGAAVRSGVKRHSGFCLACRHFAACDGCHLALYQIPDAGRSRDHSHPNVYTLAVARECIFCGGTPVEVEDAWPLWLRRRFETPAEVRATRTGEKPITFLTDKIELRLKAVCEKCNQGWMSDLEQRAEPILSPMINGVSTGLDRTTQQIVATWAVKTAMVLEHTLSAPHAIYWSPNQRAALARPPHEIPTETIVRISSYRGSQLAWYTGGLGYVAKLTSPEPMAPSTQATIVVGSLVLQVSSDRYEETTGQASITWPPPHSAKSEWIWPIQHAVVQYPPAAEPLTDAELLEFAKGQVGDPSATTTA
jgi:hypothetical protein